MSGHLRAHSRKSHPRAPIHEHWEPMSELEQEAWAVQVKMINELHATEKKLVDEILELKEKNKELNHELVKKKASQYLPLALLFFFIASTLSLL